MCKILGENFFRLARLAAEVQLIQRVVQGKNAARGKKTQPKFCTFISYAWHILLNRLFN